MKRLFLLLLLVVSFCFSSFGQTKPLYFVNGANQKFSICENNQGFDFSSYLSTYEATIGKFLSYTPVSETQNGSFTNIPKTYKNGTNVLIPTNTLYAPPTNFTGTDVFVIQVSDGTNTATTTFTVTINPLPTVAAITGNTISCGSGTSNLSDNTGNGVWSSSDTVVCTIDQATGIVTPGTAGSSTIGYTITNNATGCTNTATTTFIVSGAPVVNNVGTLTGITTICVGSTTTYTDATPAPAGGLAYWKSSNTARATVDSLSGVVTGVSAGAATIYYYVVNQYGCSAFKTRGVTVTASPVADTIAYATNNVCVGSTITLTDATAGGAGITRTWTSSNGNATISRGVGIGTGTTENVLGTTAGTDSIYFNVTSGGCTATSSLLVNIVGLPVVGAINGASSCANNTVQLTDTTLGGVWSSSSTAVATINSSTGLLTAVAAGTSTITYTVKNAYGCTSSVTSTFTVYPNANVDPITGTNSICIGSSTTLADNTVGGSWSISNSKIATIDNTGLLTGKSTGKDTVFYTYSTAGGCTQTSSFPITVASSVVVAPIQGNSSVCLNSTTQLTDATVDPTATWTSSDQTIAVVDNSGNITTIQPGVVTIQYSIGTGSCIGSALKNFIVYALPNVDNNSILDTSMCTGASVTLTNDSTGGVWSTSSSSASVSATGLVTAISSGSSVITYSITDKNGCYNSSTTTIAVNPTPATFTINGSNSTCQGGVIGYTTSLTNSVTATWLSSNTTIATLTNSGKTLSNSLVASKTNIGTTTVYCIANNGQCTRTDSVVVTVTKALVMAPIVGPSELCLGSSYTFSDSTNSGSITWSVASGTGSANISNGLVTPVSAGTATVNYSVNEGVGCTGSVSQNIVINPLPTVAPITGTTNVCAGSTITLADATKGGIWTSANKAVAIIDTGSGVLTGLVGTRGAGTTVKIYYTYTTPYGCTSKDSTNVTVTTGRAIGANTAVASLCAGSNYTFTNATTGGTWSSDNTNVATVNSSGLVTAIAGGTATIQYTITTGGGGGFGGCPSVANSNLTVVALPTVVPNTGGNTVLCAGQNSQLYNASVIPNGGTSQWSSSNTSVLTVNSTGLVTAVGAGTASIYYTVTNPKISVSTCYNTATTNFTVNANPSVAAITGSGSNLCVGNIIQLNDATPGGTWGVNDTTIATITPSTGIVTGVSGGSVIVTYTVVNSTTGCSSSVFGNGNIIALPAIGTITGNSALCMGQTSQLTNTTTQGVWNSSNTSVAKVSSTGLVTPVASGTSVISYSYTNPTYGCSNSSTDTIVVNPVPVVGAITGSSSVCYGSNITLADTSVTGSWSSSNNNIATINSSGTVTPVSTGADTLEYTVTYPGTNCSTTATLPIKVSATPIASFAVNNVSQCLYGNYFLFTNTSTISAGSISSEWTIDGKIFTSANPSYSFSAAGTYLIKLVVTSTSGCMDSTTQTVTVYPQSNPAFAINDSSQCLSGNSFTFTNNSSISSGSDGFSWNFGDGAGATTINASHSYTKAGTFTVQLITTSNYGCIDSLSQIVTTIANVTPTLSIKASSSSICAGANVSFTATATNAGTAPTYQWYKNGVAVGSNSSVYADNTLANGDSVKCTLLSNFQCLTSSTVTSNVIGISVAQYVTPSVTISTPNTTICSGTSVTFTASPSNGGVSPTYQWTVNGSNVGTNSTSYTSSTLSNGSSVVCTLTSSNACVTSRSVNSTPIEMTVNSTSTSTTTATTCSSYIWNSTTYTKSGTYTYLTKNAVGCDSTATLVLTVSYPSTSTSSITACSSYTWNGATYTKSGAYTYLTKNAVGCDSTATLVLTVNYPSTSISSATACSSYTWNGTTYTTSGTYTYLTKNAVGCDSTASLVLTVNYPSTSTSTATACGSYTWNSTTYTKSGTYSYLTKNAVGCDSTATLVLTVNYPSTSTSSVTACSSYTWNGTTYTTSGTYTYLTKNAAGCDSTATLVLTVNYPSTSTSTATACSSYTWNGITYTKSGTYTYLTKNSGGCDSTATLVLTVNYPSTSTSSATACSSYTWNGTSYTKSGTYTYLSKNAVGCDSIATLVLTVNYPSTSTSTATACTSYTWNGTTYTKSGSYTYLTKNAVGCDSTATLVLTVNYPSTSTSTATACSSYIWNGTTYTKSGTYTYLTKNVGGCDSTATLVLTVNSPSTSTSSVTACSSYTWNGTTYTTSGTYTYLTKNAVGCDSIATLVLTVNYPSTSTSTAKACSSYTWNGITYTKSGTYTYLTKNAVGCDSTASLVLTVNYPSTSTSSVTACSSYIWNGTTYTKSGTYTYLTKNVGGCDSTATLVLTVNSPSTSTSSVTACSSYTWNGTTYTTSGTYTYLTKNAVGCDSTATLILTVNYPSTSTFSATACSSYTWNGTAYTKSGTYTYLTKNSVGCDSTATLVLTVNYPSTSTSSATACSSYTWNGTTYTTSGTYTYLTKNAVGCDSTATLVLTVNYPSTSTSSVTACSSYTWNGTTYTKSGTYTYLTKNAVGCDSTATLVLTVNYPSTSTSSATACSIYTWNGTTYAKSGTYTYLTKNAVGCDSTATLLLTVNYPSTSTSSITACSSYTWNGTTYTKSGTYTYLTKNAVGCDSTATLVLTVNYPSTSTSSVTACSSYSWNGTTYTTSGTYTYLTKNAVGCDSTATLVLTVNYPSTSTSSATACSSYTWNGTTYTKSGTYTYLTKNALGCDSTATLVLTVNYPSTSTSSATACSSYSWNGTTYTTSGTYTYLTKNTVGCDSTATLVLTVNYPSTSTSSATACSSYTWNGTTYTKSGTYTYLTKNAVGCDSTASLVLNIKDTSASTTTMSICAGGSYTFNGHTYDSAGAYVVHLTNAVGCDSAATLLLTVKYPTTSVNTLSICPSSLPYTWNGLTFTSAGTKTAHLINSVGCDSAATLILTVKAISTSTTSLTICSSSLPYTWNGLTFTGAGTLTAHLTNSVGCDSAATLILTVNPITTSTTTVSICPSALPYTWNGLTFTSAGTQTAHLTNSNGCDSAATLVLNVKATSTSTTTASICAGSTYSFNGSVYDSAVVYTAHLTNSVGCDSVATLVLTVKYPTASVTTTSICAGGGYSFNGSLYDSAGTYTAHLTNEVGCDSTATLILSVNYPSSSTTNASIILGNTYLFNGNSYTSAGTYIVHLTNSTGCDSAAKLILTVVDPTSSTTTATICAGSSYTYNGTAYDSAGTYVDHFKNAGGADSTATLILTVNYATVSSTSASICAGDRYTFNGTTYDSAGTYSTHLTNSVGCDSVATLILSVKYPSISTLTTSICAGGSYSFNGTTYDSAGTYTAHFVNAVGCDSTAKLILTVNYATSSTSTVTICAGGSYSFNGKEYDSAGTYTLHLTNAAGCDSAATLILSVNYPTSSTTTASICAGSSYLFNGVNYDSAGTYIAHLTNSVNCDSAATLVLSVKYPSVSTTTASICAGGIYNFNGSSYDSAGTYTTHYVNSLGCDSTATLVLTVKYPSSSTTTASICMGGSYTFNGTTYSSAGTYTAQLTNAAGCDSTATLVLTVGQPTTSTTTASICTGGSYLFNGTSYTTGGSYVYHSLNAAGCDSAATLVLTVNQPTTSTTTASICNGGSYLFNGTTYATGGSYVYHTLNAAGCDSAATLVLTVNQPTISTTTASICNGGSYLFNGTTYTTGGSYVYHTLNAVGCDSAATLILTVNQPTTSTTNASICNGGSYLFNGTTYATGGSYVYHTLNAAGCDSAATLVLTVNQPTISTTNASIDSGSVYTFNGVSYDTSGIYTAKLTNAAGCDSIATLILVVKSTVPVKLVSFTGTYKAGATDLAWSTANETNSAHYVIERSTNGVDFIDIKEVASLNKASGSTYTYSDVINTDGKLYYRLKMVDKDGSFTYSNIVSVSISNGFTFSLYPNPVKNNLTLHVENSKTEDVTLQVINILGRVVYQQQSHLNIGINNVSLNVSNLAQGSYLLVVKGDNTQQKQFIKL